MEFTESEKTGENEEIKFSLLLNTTNPVCHFGYENPSFVLIYGTKQKSHKHCLLFR